MIKASVFGHAEHRKVGHPRVGEASKVPIFNHLNMVYTGSIWAGSQNQRLEVVFDTGSDWLVLETDLCSNCIAPFYKTEESKTIVIDSSSTSSINYGSASLTGSEATDRITVNMNTSIATAVKNMRWFAVKT